MLDDGLRQRDVRKTTDVLVSRLPPAIVFGGNSHRTAALTHAFSRIRLTYIAFQVSQLLKKERLRTNMESIEIILQGRTLFSVHEW